jgi:hypothetical protein
MSKIGNELSMRRYIYAICAVITLLCGVTLLLSSCEKEVMRIDTLSGELVTINFSLEDISYGSDEDVSRSMSFTNMEPGTVVVPVGDNLFMYATLEADPSVGTRATASGLANDTEVRILAYLNDGTTIAAQADYTGSGASLVPKSTPLKVAAGSPYRFVAYARDGALLSTLSPLNDFNPSTAPDLLWGIAESITPTGDH